MIWKAFLASVSVYLLVLVYTLLTGAKKSGDVWSDRKARVKEVFLQSWHDYTEHGWGKDVYKPMSQTGRNMGPEPLGWIIVDSLDTLMLMGCEEELAEAKAWVQYELNYDFDYNVNTFETTIRMLGGLLSAYYMSEDDVYLEKAVHLGSKLLGAFDSPTGIPYASINLKRGQGIKSHSDRGASSTAEVSTLQLEFKYLAKLTGEKLYWDKAEKVMEIMDKNQPTDGLVPIFIHPDTGKYQGNLIRLGSRGDSYYEYLIKQYLQTNEPIYLEMYLESVVGMKKHLYKKSQPSGLGFFGELDAGISGPLSPKMDHLVCFAGGMLAIGATEGLDYQTASKLPTWNAFKEEQFMLGEELTYTCYKMYHDVKPSGLAPEIVVFNTDPNIEEDFRIKRADTHNLQRPETVESLYYLYKLTGDVKYREWGYEIFENFVKHTLVESGGKDDKPRYTSLRDVTKDPVVKADNMESFWLAETLKYLYLLFDDDNNPKWDLKNVVYNTEAHPFPRFEMGSNFKTGWKRISGEPVSAPEVKVEAEIDEITEEKATAKANAKLNAAVVDQQKQILNEQDLDAEIVEKPLSNNKYDKVIDDEEPVETLGDVQEAKILAAKDNAEVADALKQKGELPSPLQPVAKPLNEQADKVKSEAKEKLESD